MMAHDLPTHALTSALNHRSSSFLAQQLQDQRTVRQLSGLSMPDVYEAFNHTHAGGSASASGFSSTPRSVSSTSDLWELPELKWLDAAESSIHLNDSLGTLNNRAAATSGKVSAAGERWAFSSGLGGDRSAANSNECQFPVQPIVNSSPAISGKCRINVPIVKDFASPSGQPSQWPSTSGYKRPASERPDSDFLEEWYSITNRTSFAERVRSETPGASNSSEAAVLATSRTVSPQEKRMATADSRASRESSGAVLGTGQDQKDKGSSSGTPEQTISPGGDSKKSANAVSDHEIHIWTERERRKKMNGMFSTLHSLLPHLTSKADKSTIVDEAINYIQSLEVTMKALLERREGSSRSKKPTTNPVNVQTSRSDLDYASRVNLTGTGSSSSTSASGQAQFRTRSSKNVVVNACGNDTFITVCSLRGQPGLFFRLLCVLESHEVHVLNAHVCTSNDTIMYMFHAQISGSQLENSDVLNTMLQGLTKCLPELSTSGVPLQ